MQIHTKVVKTKRSCVVPVENNPNLNHRVIFKLRSHLLDEACLKFELQQPNKVHSGDSPVDKINTIHIVFIIIWHCLSSRNSSATGSAGVGTLHVCEGPAAATLDGHGQLTTGARQAVARTGQSHLTANPIEQTNNTHAWCRCAAVYRMRRTLEVAVININAKMG